VYRGQFFSEKVGGQLYGRFCPTSVSPPTRIAQCHSGLPSITARLFPTYLGRFFDPTQ
jgi:hypothetical protein